jgi:hypothetical protein
MNRFRDSDYVSLRYPAHKLVADTTDKFPELKLYTEFKELRDAVHKDTNISYITLFKWIVFMYDKNSPFLKYYSDYEKRNFEAALEAGFVTKSNGKLNKSYMDVVIGESKYRGEINRAILRYCRIQSDSLFYQMAVLENQRHESNEK